MNATPPLRLFSGLVRVVLPRRFHQRFGRALLDTVRDRWRLVRAATPHRRLRFWANEVWGLALLAGREHLDVAGDRLDALFHHPSSTPTRSGWSEMLHTLRQDLTYAVRMIIKTPVVSLIAVLSLAIGISANTTIFSVMNRWLLRPLPYPDAERLVMAWELDRGNPNVQTVSPGNFLEWSEGATSFGDWLASNYTTMTMTGVERPEQVTVAEVTPNFFQLLEVPTILGRQLARNEGGPEDELVAVLNESLWRNRFGADSGAIGRTVLLDGNRYTIVGVVPETFDFLVGSVDLWTANTFVGDRDDRTNRALIVTGKLRPGISIEQAQIEMTELATRLEARFPETNEGVLVELESVRDTFPSATDRGLIRILTAVVLLVLIVACVNVASLLLAKTDARHRELGIRSALGAGRGRIARQLLTESIVLATMAGALGMMLAVPGISAVSQAMPDELPAFFAPEFDRIVVMFSIGVSIVAGLAFGISPVSQVMSGTPLLEHSRGGSGSRARKRIRSAFVISEFALALSVLIGAAVLTDLFSRRLQIDPGFETGNLLTSAVTLPEYKYDTDAKVVDFLTELDERSVGLPGVTDHAIATVLPRTRSLPFAEFSLETQPPADEDDLPSTSWLAVNSTYFRALDVPLRQGRAFTPADRAGMPAVVVVNQRFVEQFLSDEDAIGARLSIEGDVWEIVGVAANVTQRRLDGLLPIAPAVYFPLAQRPSRGLRLMFRTDQDPLLAAGPVQDMVQAIDPEQPVYAIQTMAEHFALQLSGPNIMASILLVVGSLALALAAIGIYGVMAYNVSLQAREIGIRMALGANPGRVLRSITAQGSSLAGLGLLVGTPLAAAILAFIARVVADPTGIGGAAGSQSPITAAPIISVGVVLALVGGVASFLPARRAVRVDPVRVLSAD